MAEGVAAADGQVIAEGVYDDPDRAPDPDPVRAPKGWTWNRKGRQWQPKVRGPVLTERRPPRAPAAALASGVSSDVGDDDEIVDAEIVDEEDPAPAWMGDDSAGSPEDFTLTDDMRADVRALVALAYVLPSEGLPLLDPYCFGPLQQKKTSDGIINSVSDIICSSPRVAKWAVSAAGLMPWIKLSYALKPVALNVLHHHITKSVEVTFDRAEKSMTVTKNDWSQYPAA